MRSSFLKEFLTVMLVAVIGMAPWFISLTIKTTGNVRFGCFLFTFLFLWAFFVIRDVRSKKLSKLNG